MKIRPLLLGSLITLALVFMLIVGCVGGLVVAPYVLQRIGTLRYNASAPVIATNPRSNIAAPTPAPAVQVSPVPTPTAVPLPADASPAEKVASDVYRKVSPSVVYIQVQQSGSGSGVTPRSQIPGVPGFPNQPPSGVQVASGSG